jgi:hypothetical protein
MNFLTKKAVDTHITQRSEPIDEDAAATIKLLLKLGHQQKRIASLFDCNQGRISEIASGAKFGHIKSLDEQFGKLTKTKN